MAIMATAILAVDRNSCSRQKCDPLFYIGTPFNRSSGEQSCDASCRSTLEAPNRCGTVVAQAQ